jgi:hypothetical protein
LEFVHIPGRTRVHDQPPRLPHQRAVGQLEQLPGVRHRDLVLEFLARRALRNALHGQEGARAGDAHAHGAAGVALR